MGITLKLNGVKNFVREDELPKIEPAVKMAQAMTLLAGSICLLTTTRKNLKE